MSSYFDIDPIPEFTKEERDRKAMEDMAYTGYHFMQAITNHYGPEKGIILWDNIVQHLPEVKGKIFMDMLSGNPTFRKIEVMPTPNTPGSGKEKVNAIKAVREGSHMGLKEAKDLIDTVDGYNYGQSNGPGRPMSFDLIDGVDRKDILRKLQSAGYKAR